MRRQKAKMVEGLTGALDDEGVLRLVLFSLDGRRYALYLSKVLRTLRAVDISPLPECPESVLGVINLQGKVIPVFNVRRRFRLPEREMLLSDQLVIANASRRTVGLLVDETTGVIERDSGKIVPPETILPEMPYVQGVIKLDDGLILIHDLDTFLSLDEEEKLAHAMNEA